MMKSTLVPAVMLCLTRSLSSVVAFSAAAASTTASSSPLKIDNPFEVGNVKAPKLKHGMDYVRLGDSELVVSKVCMGCMTYGEQNSLEEGVALLNCAFDDYAVNFLDTAEIYPVPTKPDTQGLTDAAVKEFLKSRDRNKVIVATKVAGRSPRLTWLPRGDKPDTPCDLTREQILQSVDASLERLGGIDYIDLLQIHWPGRYTGGMFGSPDFLPSQYEDDSKGDLGVPVPFQEQLAALQELIQAGKVRYIGVSNETPFGVCSMAALAEQFPDLYPKIVSIQNSYSLVVRKDYEAGLAEACYHHNVALLPYSPLASGTLTGKYRSKETSKDARMTLFPGFMERYLQSLNEEAVNAYCDLAAKYDLTPTQLALSWCYHNELVASTIIGATTMEQLQENIEAYDVKLDDVDPKIMEEINDIYKKYTDPTKARNNPQ